MFKFRTFKRLNKVFASALLLTFFMRTQAAALDRLDAGLLGSIKTWAESTEQYIRQNGVALTPQQLEDAKFVGVKNPERIRILFVGHIPTPADPTLAQLSATAGLTNVENAAQTIRYGIFVRADVAHDRKLFLHEFTHVAQYESLGGIGNFLAAYLPQVMSVGYAAAPFELQAIANEAKLNRLTNLAGR